MKTKEKPYTLYPIPPSAQSVNLLNPGSDLAVKYNETDYLLFPDHDEAFYNFVLRIR